MAMWRWVGWVRFGEDGDEDGYVLGAVGVLEMWWIDSDWIGAR